MAHAIHPLVVSKTNPRYFAITSGDGGDEKAVYLTGSHIWNNLHDGLGPGAACADVPEQNDYHAYLDFLKAHGHNFIRLWRWEHFNSKSPDGGFHLCMSPQPWARTGEGLATDGKAKFDLSSFDPAYFDRLRERVTAASKESIYVAVMLFDGFAIHLSPAPENIEGHPFYAANNVNNINVMSMRDYQVLPLDPRIQAIQEAYIRKVVDTVHDLPNVLYEVANEAGGAHMDSIPMPDGSSYPLISGDSTEWQYWVIDFVKRYEHEQGYAAHPLGMTMQYPVPDQQRVNEVLWNSPADWISPGFDDTESPGMSSRWVNNPPANDGRKVVITDTDHYAPTMGDALWAWKSFLRGHNPILMDYGIIDVVNPLDPSTGVPSYESFEGARYAMGDTLRFAEQMRLIDMTPRDELSSTGYALANPGVEYLVLQPTDSHDPFTVTMLAGDYTARWFHVGSRQTEEEGTVSVPKDGVLTCISPFAQAGASVLYLKRGSNDT